jgi:hypothetical protein
MEHRGNQRTGTETAGHRWAQEARVGVRDGKKREREGKARVRRVERGRKDVNRQVQEEEERHSVRRWRHDGGRRGAGKRKHQRRVQEKKAT